MAPIKYTTPVLALFPETWEYAEQSIVRTSIEWLLSRNKRVSVNLQRWLHGLTTAPSEAMVTTLQSIPVSGTYDDIAVECLAWIRRNIVYAPDTENWRDLDYWATPEETLFRKRGDCEDGAVLLYQLLRFFGVPANRLLLWAGDLTEGGHVCLFYKPNNYPLDFVALDWCFQPTDALIASRTFYQFFKENIFAWKHNKTGLWTQTNTPYLRSWFFFNEDVSYKGYNQRT